MGRSVEGLDGHRPVRPIDLEGFLASMPEADDEPATRSHVEETVMLRDPSTGGLMRVPVSKEAAAELQAIFDRMAARQSLAEKVASDVHDVTMDMSSVGSNLEALRYLFLKAVADDGPDTPLTAASYLVIDIMETIAQRLDAMEVQANAAYAPIANTWRQG